MKSKRVFAVIFVLTGLLACSFFASASIDVNTLLLKVTLHTGDFVNKTFSISSTDGGTFSLQTATEGVQLDEDSFSLQPGESKVVQASFNAQSLQPGIYVGSIEIAGQNEASYIPVIFEVQSKDQVFGVNLEIPPQYTDLHPGEKMVAQLKVFDLTTNGGTSNGLGPSTVEVVYNVYHGLNGKLISSESENLVVNDQAQLTKTLSLPEEMPEGEYVFTVAIQYKSSVSTSSRTFRVSEVQQSPAAFSIFSNQQFVYIGIIAVFFVGIIFLFMYFIHDRDNLILELKQYNAWEVEKHKEFLTAQSELLQKRGLIKPREAQREVDQKVSELKEKQNKRVQEIKTLKSEGNTRTMQQKVAEWKKQGYNTLALESKLNPLSESDMRQLLKEWKAKYSSDTEGYKKK